MLSNTGDKLKKFVAYKKEHVVEEKLLKIFANGKMVVERSVGKNMVNKKMKVNQLSVILFGVEGLKQVSCSDRSLFFHFNNSSIGFYVLNRGFLKVYPSKEQKYIKEKKTNKKASSFL